VPSKIQKHFVISLFNKGSMMLKKGTKAPDFTLENQDGNSVSLSDYKGQKVLLWFYPKASTPG
tara:strand:+ start:6620 stop:6808 length:189 start_codon:yes stop_codon:yes gene_type:complete